MVFCCTSAHKLTWSTLCLLIILWFCASLLEGLNPLLSISIDVKSKAKQRSETEMNGPDVSNLEDVGRLHCIGLKWLGVHDHDLMSLDYVISLSLCALWKKTWCAVDQKKGSQTLPHLLARFYMYLNRHAPRR